MTALINYKQVKQTKNSLCYILLYNKKIISKIKDNSFLEEQLNIINHNIKLAISQNQEISEINLSSRLKIILVSLESKKNDLFNEKSMIKKFFKISKYSFLNIIFSIVISYI